MRLGKLTMLLAVLMIPVMYLTAVWQVARANQPPFTDPLTWTDRPARRDHPVCGHGVAAAGPTAQRRSGTSARCWAPRSWS